MSIFAGGSICSGVQRSENLSVLWLSLTESDLCCSGRSGRRKVAVDTPRAVTGTVVGVVDDAVYDCGEAAGDPHKQDALWQL